MHHHINHYSIQQISNGQSIQITEHIFKFSSSGPKIYLQANLHGSEVFGTFLLGRIINHLKSLSQEEIEKNNITGTVVIVPTANPIAAQNTVYNGMTGRWNPISGTNWNRIFDSREFGSKSQMQKFYTNQLTAPNASIESLLAARLMLLAKDSDYAVDIHTTGRETIPHIFSHPDHAKYFQQLETIINISTTNTPASPSFENSIVWPLINSVDTPPIVCTWEASNHSAIDFKQIQFQENRLWNWLMAVWSDNFPPSTFVKNTIEDTNIYHLTSPMGGYFSWQVEIGEIVKKDQVYAIFYQPYSDQFVEAVAQFDFILIGKYGIGAIAQGEQIAFIAKI